MRFLKFEGMMTFWVMVSLLIVLDQAFGQQSKSSTTIFRENSGAPGVFLRMGVGTRALALGGAFTGLANDVSALYWNPAGLDRIRGLEIEFMNADMPFDRNFNYVGASVPVRDLFTLGIGWIGLRIENIEARSGNSQEADYLFGSAQDALLLSFSKSLSRYLALGTNLKLIRNDLDSDVATGIGFDASMHLRLADWLFLGFVAQDLGTDYRWNSGLVEGVPLSLRGGIALEPYEGMSVTLDGNRIAGGKTVFNIGTEITLFDLLPVRLGLQGDSFTGGAGFRLPISNHRIEVDYGYGLDPVANDQIHRLSVLLSFGQNGVRTPTPHPPGGVIYGQDTPKKPAPAGKAKVVVLAELLNVRSGPGIGYGKIAQIEKGESFRLLECHGKWKKIRLSGDKVGWVNGKYVSQERAPRT